MLEADQGRSLSCKVTAVNSEGLASKDSINALEVPGVGPESLEAPHVSGTASVGQVLTCLRGTWKGQPPPTFTYQWLRNGAGITSAFLAQRGAIVTAIDISAASIARGRELADRLGFQIQFITGELTPSTFPAHSFDAVVGRFALHHVDLRAIAPIFNEILVPGGVGAFLETMALNPLLNLSRRLPGRVGVASYGTQDERPIDRADLRIIEESIGSVTLAVGRMAFLRIFDRNVLRFRRRRVSALLGAVDDRLARMGLGSLSYHQIVKVRKPAPRC